MIAYKILDKDMKSFIVSDFISKYTICYKMNKIIKAPLNTLGIFCFTTINATRKYLIKYANTTNLRNQE